MNIMRQISSNILHYVGRIIAKNISIIAYFLICIPTLLTAQTLKSEWVQVNKQGCKVLDPYYKSDASLTWEGPCLNGLAIGKGTLTKYVAGEFESTFEGKMNYGVREGFGRFTHKDGSIKEGSFVKGQLTGMGTMIMPNGEKYEGQFLNYRLHGKGKLVEANGAVSDGFFVSDRFFSGKYTNPQGRTFDVYNYRIIDNINDIKKTGYYPQIGKQLTEYFDKDWQRSTRENATYYRIVTYESPNKPKGPVRDYFMNGNIQSEFFAEYLDYDDDNKNFHEGEATWYYPDGSVEQKRYYYNNKINGKNSYYHENGELKEERTYDYGILNGTYKQWYKTGKNKLFALYESGKLVGEKYIEFDENGTGAFVHHENFQANKSEWEASTSGAYSKVKLGNELSLVLSGESTASRYNHIAINQNGDYSIESIIQKNTGKTLEGYGLIFGLQDWDNYFEFSISEQGSYIIYQKFEGVYIKIKDWTTSSAIYKGNQRNRLKILKLNEDFIFSINGEVVARHKASLFRGNNIGLMARGKGEFTLENIIVREFVTEEELAKLSTAEEDESTSEWKGSGSGFFLSVDGYIATNYHVVEDAQEIQVEYFQQGNKRIHPAVVVVSDKQNDLSIIKIKDPEFRRLAIIPYAFSTGIKDVGSSVFTLGYPMTQIMGEEIKFTDGKINSKTGIGGDITHYQISVPIQPGNSGGPLFDEQGFLVGITSSGLDRDRYTAQNVNYAIKTSYLKNLIDVLPSKMALPSYINIANRTLTDKIKILSDYIPIIRVK